jgi:hypothetical protein
VFLHGKIHKKGIVEVQRAKNTDRNQTIFSFVGNGSTPCPTAGSYSKASTCHTVKRETKR